MNDANVRMDAIRSRLNDEFPGDEIEIFDDSASHAGHVGARDGRGHFDLVIVSERFAGLGKVARHRLIYVALDDLMKTDIHALSIRALTPSEMP